MKPATVQDLIQLVQQKIPMSHGELTDILLQLESEGRLKFKTRQTPPTSLKDYLFSSSGIWFWLTLAIVFLVATTIFLVPEATYPLVYLRQALGVVFVGFVPGFVFLKSLYPLSVRMIKPTESLNFLEQVVLSVGLSVSFVAIVGLIFNYTPFGINLLPVTITLSVFTLFFASIGIVREYAVCKINFNENSASTKF